jgi:RNA polymerase sigma-70 factor (ECF subfamily)
MTPIFQDTAWIAAFREGKAGTFEQVFKEYHRSMCYLAEKYLLDKEEAEDVVADAFTKLWHGRMQFSDAGHIKGFLITSIRNACLNLLKQKQRRSASNNELAYLLVDKEDDFFRKLVETELLKKLYPFIEQLPKQCRAVFEQVYFEGSSIEETATKLGISTRNVRSQKSRAEQLLRDKILLISFIYCLMSMQNNAHIDSNLPSIPEEKKEK